METAGKKPANIKNIKHKGQFIIEVIAGKQKKDYR